MSRAESELCIVYEDDRLLVVNKPAGLATMGVADDQPSLLSQLQRYFSGGGQQEKPFVAIVSRLDFHVSGIVVAAKDPVSASHLHSQFAERQVRKVYHALVSAAISPDEAELIDWLEKSKRNRKVHVVSERTNETQQARLRYRTLRRVGGVAILRVELLTGRKHQIRAQLASHGYPILGDYKYKSPAEFPGGIALVSKRVEFEHPASGAVVAWEIDYPRDWAAFVG
jgi:23S rRNA pseudouridine1911/1915/1917 synthase